MLKKLNKTNKGFTIIEVLIVLAIAALILLIIFFAVPALQRNNRNTQLRNDASVTLGFVNDYASNHNGAFPVGAFYDTTTGNLCFDTAAVTACATTGATGYVGKIRAGLAVPFTISPTAPAALTATSATQTLNVWIGGKCNAAAWGTANTRAAAVGYLTETAGANVVNCVET